MWILRYTCHSVLHLPHLAKSLHIDLQTLDMQNSPQEFAHREGGTLGRRPNIMFVIMSFPVLDSNWLKVLWTLLPFHKVSRKWSSSCICICVWYQLFVLKGKQDSCLYSKKRDVDWPLIWLSGLCLIQSLIIMNVCFNSLDRVKEVSLGQNISLFLCNLSSLHN